ncbi:fumarylacetoacetate hydrolase family protein [Halobacillus rhizosphaerae]|uniref:fumarylacetoacetate hydrolase family protein n=1 Tax=Halobacillus rhizosphaerae TaxID=3064889 RepID=UPI00398B21ED
MKLVTIKHEGSNLAAIHIDKKYLTLRSLNTIFHTDWPEDLFQLIHPENFSSFQTWWNKSKGEAGFEDHYLSEEGIECLPLYRNPRKIWGIGLNYQDHASDLNEKAPQTEPASFMKPDTTIIGYEDTVIIPKQSERTTAEAELGIVIGKKCKDVSIEEAKEVIAGYTPVIDMTAEDILQRNPRYLTRSKSFDTFFSFGPQLLTPDEIEDVLELNVSTKINGQIHRKNVVKNMTFNPYDLISFHSKVMTLLPGDIISTGTPGAVVIKHGDQVGCQIDGFTSLKNRVKDVKV